MFKIVVAVIFRSKLSDQLQLIMLMKNLASAGGLLILAERSTVLYGLDWLFKKKVFNVYAQTRGDQALAWFLSLFY